jgi:hypothetical protein
MRWIVRPDCGETGLQMVTCLKTLVPCAKRQKLGTFTNEPSLEWTQFMKSLNPDVPVPPGAAVNATGRQEVRCAVRFPLALPVVLSTGNGDVAALTRNISASGVLFELDRTLQVGMEIQFSMRMPRAVLGTPHDVLVHCKGRVVRCSSSHKEHLAAATIDEYRFAEQ